MLIVHWCFRGLGFPWQPLMCSGKAFLRPLIQLCTLIASSWLPWQWQAAELAEDWFQGLSKG